MKKVLVTGVGGPTPRSFVRAVKWFGGDYSGKFDFIGVDCNPLAYGLYNKKLFSTSYIVPRADNPNYWNEINRIINENDIDAAIILPELEVIEWAKNASQKLEKNILTHLPAYDLAMALINKHRLHHLLKDTSFIPNFYRLNPSAYDFAEVKNAVGDVFWVRSTEGSSGLGSLKIENEESLHEWIAINPGVAEFIATEYLPGRNLACKLLYFNGSLYRTACAERVNYIMAKVAPSGITGNTSFGRLLNEPGLVEASVKALTKLSEALSCNLNGIFTVDFKEDGAGNPKITEINIRHVAFTSAIAAGGANLPLDTLKAMFMDGADMNPINYVFPDGLIFLRDVDESPIVMKEVDLLPMA